MFKLLFAVLGFFAAVNSADLPSRKFVNLAAIKTMVAAAEAEAKKLNVEVTICIVDESGNLLFLQKADAAPLNTIEFAQKKARHAALYKRDRKSTRLNSSHSQISYAVFCLKKKKHMCMLTSLQ